MHNCSIWALLLEHHLALKCCRDELNQPCGSFGEQIRSDGMESFRYWFSGHSLRNVYFEATVHGLTRIEQMGTLRDGRDSPRGRTPCAGKPRGRRKSREVAVSERERTHQ